MELICIKCPRGCHLNVDGENVTGNLCPRGKDYAIEEMTCPMRIVTALVKSTSGEIFPVKTSTEVPKVKINEVLKAISNIQISDAKFGDVLLKNICGTDADIIVTGDKYIAQ